MRRTAILALLVAAGVGGVLIGRAAAHAAKGPIPESEACVHISISPAQPGGSFTSYLATDRTVSGTLDANGRAAP